MKKSSARFAKEVNRVRKALAKSTKKVEKILAKRKNYLLTFYCYDRNGKDLLVLRQPFLAKNDKKAKEIAQIHLNPYRTGLNQPQNPRLEKLRVVAEGKELLN